MRTTTHVETGLTALDAIYGRRSVREYASTPVDAATVRALADAAVQAPTAMHEEPWVFAVIQDPRALLKVSDRAKAQWLRDIDRDARLHHGQTRLSHDAFLSQLEDPYFSIFYDAGTLIVIGTRRTDPFAVADCWLAAQNLMLAAYALGLGSCCIGSAASALNDPDIRTELGIPPDVTAIAPIIVGVPAGPVHPVTRAEPEIVCWK